MRGWLVGWLAGLAGLAGWLAIWPSVWPPIMFICSLKSKMNTNSGAVQISKSKSKPLIQEIGQARKMLYMRMICLCQAIMLES